MKASVVAVLTLSLLAAGASVSPAAEPAKPTSVRQVRLDPEHVLLTWKDKSNNEDGFEILRRTVVDPNFESRGTVGPGVTQFLDEVPRGTVYIYEVVAFNEDGESDSSNQCYVNRNPPPVPSYFNARLIALYLVRVSWSDRANGEDGFEIQRADFGKRFKTIARVDRNTETYDDATLKPANSYTYRMRTLGKPAICWKNSKYTVERSVTTKGGVRLLQVELRGRGQGTVVSSPPGISCGPKDDHCSAEFPLAVNVTLTAKPANSKSYFGAWADYKPCEKIKGPCTVYTDESRVIGAAFRRRRE